MMEKEFAKEGFWAVILGGSMGMGLASAKKLAQAGMNVCILHRNSRAEMHSISDSFAAIEQTGIQFLSFNIDATNPQKITATVKAIQKEIGEGKIRCLVHSIAKGNLKPMKGEGESELRWDDFSITLDNMALSLYEWVKALHTHQMFTEDSRIISFTSEGNKMAQKYYGAVSVAKAALEAITRNIALEFAPFGIRANCIQAGVTDTRSQRMIPGSDRMKRVAKKRNPFNRITTTEDVANVVYLLCKEEAAWINGVVIPVDGGASITL